MSTGLAAGVTTALIVLKVTGAIGWPWLVVLSVALVPLIVKAAFWLWVHQTMKRSTRTETYRSSRS